MTKKKRTSNKLTSKRNYTNMRSLKLYKETTPFLTFQITDQTIYWSFILLTISALVVWTLAAGSNIMDILNGVLLRLN